MLVLDIGCGTGTPPVRAQLAESDCVIGIDISRSALRTAKERFPHRYFLASKAESLPFADNTFSRVVSAIAVPYTDIIKTLAEARRVLAPQGSLVMSLHTMRFTLAELRGVFPRPVATLFRIYVLLNGIVFHLTGKLIPFGNGRIESFQTERSMRHVLARAGFCDVRFSHPTSRFIVEATLKDKLEVMPAERAEIEAPPRLG